MHAGMDGIGVAGSDGGGAVRLPSLADALVLVFALVDTDDGLDGATPKILASIILWQSEAKER
jgi:hypothetical protein